MNRGKVPRHSTFYRGEDLFDDYATLKTEDENYTSNTQKRLIKKEELQTTTRISSNYASAQDDTRDRESPAHLYDMPIDCNPDFSPTSKLLKRDGSDMAGEGQSGSRVKLLNSDSDDNSWKFVEISDEDERLMLPGHHNDVDHNPTASHHDHTNITLIVTPGSGRRKDRGGSSTNNRDVDKAHQDKKDDKLVLPVISEREEDHHHLLQNDWVEKTLLSDDGGVAYSAEGVSGGSSATRNQQTLKNIDCKESEESSQTKTEDKNMLVLHVPAAEKGEKKKKEKYEKDDISHGWMDTWDEEGAGSASASFGRYQDSWRRTDSPNYSVTRAWPAPLESFSRL